MCEYKKKGKKWGTTGGYYEKNTPAGIGESSRARALPFFWRYEWNALRPHFSKDHRRAFLRSTLFRSFAYLPHTLLRSIPLCAHSSTLFSFFLFPSVSPLLFPPFIVYICIYTYITSLLQSSTHKSRAREALSGARAQLPHHRRALHLFRFCLSLSSIARDFISPVTSIAFFQTSLSLPLSGTLESNRLSSPLTKWQLSRNSISFCF